MAPWQPSPAQPRGSALLWFQGQKESFAQDTPWCPARVPVPAGRGSSPGSLHRTGLSTLTAAQSWHCPWAQGSPRALAGLCHPATPSWMDTSIAALQKQKQKLEKKGAAICPFTNCLPLLLLHHLAQNFLLSNPTSSIVNLFIFHSSEGRLMNVFPADQRTGSVQPSSTFSWTDNAHRNSLCLFNYLPLLH